MQNIIVDKPYRFVPPKVSPVWTRLIHAVLPMYLRRKHGITSFHCVGADRLRKSLDDGAGVMLAANHCRPADPMAMGLLSREVARPFTVMASWHVFMESRLQSFLVQRMGGFSVYREGLDRESLKCAINILAEARHPLVIFPEGIITRNNDRLFNLMDGVTFLARAAAKQRAASSQPGKVVIHPVFLRYRFEGDIEATLAPVMNDIESRLSWQPQTQLPLVDRIVKVGHALLALKEVEHLGEIHSGEAGERIRHLLNRVLEPLESEWTAGNHDGEVMARIKRLRTAILPDLITGEIDERERARRWRQLSDLYFAQQLHCYSGDYLAGQPSNDRLLETVERFEEDLTDAARAHSPMRVTLHVGEALEASSTRDRSSTIDPLADSLRASLQSLLETS